MFVHDSLAEVVSDHGVDFAARHFRREAEASADDPATLGGDRPVLRYVATQCRLRPGGEAQGRALLLLGLDYARRLRADRPDRRSTAGSRPA